MTGTSFLVWEALSTLGRRGAQRTAKIFQRNTCNRNSVSGSVAGFGVVAHKAVPGMRFTQPRKPEVGLRRGGLPARRIRDCPGLRIPECANVRSQDGANALCCQLGAIVPCAVIARAPEAALAGGVAREIEFVVSWIATTYRPAARSPVTRAVWSAFRCGSPPGGPGSGQR